MLKSLTSLRFFAMLLVFLSHLNFMSSVPKYKDIYDRFFSDGSIGVTFFLILSGFVMSYNYIERFESIDKKYVKTFIIKRIARIYPIHIITLFISIPLMGDILHSISFVLKLIINLLLLQSLTMGKFIGLFNPVSWTLSCLMVFYILTPMILYLLNKMIRKYKISSLFYFIVAVYLIGFVTVKMFYVDNNSVSTWFFYISPFFRIIDYLIGLTVGVIFKEKRDKFKNINMTMWENLIVVLYIIMILYRCNIDDGLRLGIYYIPVSTLLIFIFAFQGGAISKLLSKNIFIKLGDISFSFYLIHYLIISYSNLFIEKVLKMQYNENLIIIEIVSTFVISIILSLINFKYIEIPAKNKINSKINNLKSAK